MRKTSINPGRAIFALLLCLLTAVAAAPPITASTATLIKTVEIRPDAPITLKAGEKPPEITWSAPAGAHYRVDNGEHKAYWFNNTDWERMTDDEVFKEGNTYSVNFFLWPDAGAEFADPKEMTAAAKDFPYSYETKIYECWNGTERAVDFVFKIPYELPPGPLTEISTVSVDFSPELNMVVGEHPAMSSFVPDGAHYSVESVSWFDVGESRNLNAYDTFRNGGLYEAKVTFVPDSGYVFSERFGYTVTGVPFESVTSTFKEFAPLRSTVTVKFRIVSYEPLIADVVLNPVQELTLRPGETPPEVSFYAPSDAMYAPDNYEHAAYWFNRTDWRRMEKDEVFEAGKEYSVDVFLWCADDCFFDDPSAMSATVNRFPYSYSYEIHKCWTGFEREVTVIFRIPTPEEAVISEVSVGFGQPLEYSAGAMPSTDVQTAPGAHYSVQRAGWVDVEADANLTDSDRFEEGKTYYLGVILEADGGYSFSKEAVKALTFGIGNEYLSSVTARRKSGSLVIKISFEPVKTKKPEIHYTLGDVDDNGIIEVNDARLCLRRAINIETYAPGSREFLACDVDRSDSVSVNDARSILRVAINLDDPSEWSK